MRPGYAPAEWRALTDHLVQQGATEQEVIAAGLARVNSTGRVNDVFRNRVVMGVRDHADGALVGFTGRDLSDGAHGAPKYLNTPQTAAFDKSRLLLGLAEAPEGAEVTRVEGMMDVAAVNLAGEGKVVGVAPMGTALTDQAAELLAARAVNGRVRSALDNDEAGRKAAEHDVAQLAPYGVSTRQISLAEGDPAEAYQRNRDGLAGQLSVPSSVLPPVGAALLDQELAERPFGNSTERWQAVQAASRHVAAAPRQDQREMVSAAVDAVMRRDPATPRDAAWEHVNAELSADRPGRRWAPGTSWQTLAADLAGDVDAARGEGRTEALEAADREANRAVLEHDRARLHEGRRQQAIAADPADLDPDTRDRVIRDEEYARNQHDGNAIASTSAAADLRATAASLAPAADVDQDQPEDARRTTAPPASRPAERPAVYDRAAGADLSNVDTGTANARRQASAAFSRSTPESVGAARSRAGNRGRKPAKSALSPRRGRNNDLGR
ncbi:toprim domain-containing protein [Luteipulveratus halotolerans]|uniref:toprim domain-containing protein n=1 Tax=Luteipulveratus halotolerans TaxID=1631356 RepID=UPI000681AEA9|nr:toprim domain-containing protein [Luteipulveratus halotolerans]